MCGDRDRMLWIIVLISQLNQNTIDCIFGRLLLTVNSRYLLYEIKGNICSTIVFGNIKNQKVKAPQK